MIVDRNGIFQCQTHSCDNIITPKIIFAKKQMLQDRVIFSCALKIMFQSKKRFLL